MMKFDVIVGNPPFQDRTKRGRTPHKLWIEFTDKALSTLLADGGLLLQVSPASFRSPSNPILPLMRLLCTEYIDFDIDQHFPGVGSTFAYYRIRNSPRASKHTTRIRLGGATFNVPLNEKTKWLPNDLCRESLSIHSKVMFSPTRKLNVEHDYVTNHNSRVKKRATLSKERTALHTKKVFHTNNQHWWSSIDQPCASKKKVLWTKSGYTKPFYDPGTVGVTDMGYFVVVSSDAEGRNLAHNLNLPLMQYVFRTAKWSGFGNELVFESLPALPTDRCLTHDEICQIFGLTQKERDYVRRSVG